MFTKTAKIIRFLTIDVATTNNSALDVAEGAESGNNKDGKVSCQTKCHIKIKQVKFLKEE